jgi:hypothetical protein
MRAAILCLALLAAAAASAAAEVTLAFRDGRTASAKAVSADDEGLLLEDGSRVLWSELRPESALAARRALTPADDGAARLELHEFALALDLYAEAQRELEIAFALKAVDEAEFERREKALEEAEVESFRIRIDGLLETDDHPSETLRAIRELRERHPAHPLTLSYEPRVKELVDRLAAMEGEEAASKEEAKKDKALDALRETLRKLEARKTAAVAKGDELRKAGAEAAAKGQISRTLKSLTEPAGAEKQYKSARALLRDMARADRRFQVVTKEQIQKEADAISRSLVDCYLICARTLLGQRNYKGAAEFVRKVLLYDPIQEEALEMAEEIKRNRISFKVSDLTNARPRVSGG